MFSRVKSLFRRITGFSVPMFGLQWQPPPEPPEIPAFDGTIAITGDENASVIEFLEANVGNMVFVDCVIDACLATSRHYEVVAQQNLDLDSIAQGEISGKRFALLNPSKALRHLEIGLLPNHRVHTSFGGTGVIQIPLQGFFEVSATAHGGPAIVFYLTEHTASVELRLQVKQQGKRAGSEPPRVSRRLQPLRRWSHEEIHPVFP